MVALFDDNLKFDQESAMVRMVDSKGQPHNVSLWDIFAPGRTIRTGHTKKKTEKNVGGDPSTKNGTKTVDDPTEGNVDATGEAGHSKVPAEDSVNPGAKDPGKGGEVATWTMEQDGTLLAMKGEEKSWGEIADATEKKEEETKERYGFLMASMAENIKAKGKSKVEGSRSTVASVVEPILIPPLRDDASDTDPFVEGNKAKAADVADVDTKALDAGLNLLNSHEAMELTRIHDYFESAKWVAIASQFFDQTGRRFAPEVLRHQLEKADK